MFRHARLLSDLFSHYSVILRGSGFASEIFPGSLREVKFSFS
jgi:hypothetical protein